MNKCEYGFDLKKAIKVLALFSLPFIMKHQLLEQWLSLDWITVGEWKYLYKFALLYSEFDIE